MLVSRYSVRGIAVSVIAVLAFVAICAVVLGQRRNSPVYTYELESPDSSSDSEDESDIAEPEYVYYAEGSDFWHKDADCPLLFDENVLYETTAADAEKSGYSPCPECAG